MKLRHAVLLASCLFAAVPAVAQETPAVKTYPVEKLSFTYYYYNYQGDTRKLVPADFVKYPDGSSQFAFTPLEGIGPWYSTLRTQWHKDQIADIRKAGIDVILPVFSGDTASRQRWSVQGLDCLVQALKDLNEEQKEAPQVAMFLDTNSLRLQYGKKNPDLKQDEVKQSLYGMIRDFFLRVPPEYRALVALPAEHGGGAANVVVLYSAAYLSDLDESFISYCSQRFEKDFGTKLVILGGPDFKAKAPKLDGFAPVGAGLGSFFEGDGWIKVGVVGPGYEDSAIHGRLPQIRPRLSGETYRKDWSSLLSNDPNWVILDSWNQWREGTQIAPDRVDSYQMVDYTRLFLAQFNGMKAVDAKILNYSIPPIMLPKTIYQTDLVIRNSSKTPWKPTDSVSVSYRWFKDGKPLDDGGIRVPITKTVVAGGTTYARLGISTTTADGNPLPAGDYELHIDLNQPNVGWFEDNGDVPVRAKVQIGKPKEIAATFLTSDMPAMVKSGRNYPVMVRVRNDGSATWTKADGFGLSYQWRKISSAIHDFSQESEEVVEPQGVLAQLPYDVEPGRIVEIPITLKTSDHTGKALPEWKSDDPWTYQIQWGLVRGKDLLADAGIRRETVEMLPDDYGVSFVGTNVPRVMAADSHISINVGIKNTGSETWGMLNYRLSYHWYYLDGVECIWEGEKTMLPRDVAPGETVVVHDVKIKAPPTPGPHVLVFDLMDGDRWTSTATVTRGADMLRMPIYIQAQNHVFFDLTKLYNVAAISTDSDYAQGDFDGQGNSYAAEFLPPEINARDLGPDAYPCGYLCAATGEKAMSSRRIVFRWPSKLPGAKNAISCTGQQFGMAPDRFVSFHILGAATVPDAKGDFILVYSDGSKMQLPVTMSSWLEAPQHGEHIAATSLHRHGKNGDQRGTPCYLFHYTLQTDRSLPIVGIIFPNNPDMKVVALTGQTIITIPEPKVNPLIKQLEDKLKQGTK